MPTVLTLGDRAFELPASARAAITDEALINLAGQLGAVTEAGAAVTPLVGVDLQLPGEEPPAERPNLELRESATCELIWRATSARSTVLELLDREGENQDLATFLQSVFDGLTVYVRDLLKIEDEERKALEMARSTYEDEPSVAYEAAPTPLTLRRPDGIEQAIYLEPDGEVWMEADTLPVTEALTATQRKRTAAVTRVNEDGEVQYLFPIPDEAHARVALAMLRSSSLTMEERIKVRRRAYRVLGYPLPVEGEQVGEGSHGSIATMDQVELLIEAPRPKQLGRGELEATLIMPGFNRSKERFYEKSTLTESVAGGQFTDLKMYFNHPTKSGFRDRPERGLEDWVATIKEAWVSEDGSVQGKIVVWRRWFQDYLQELKEAGLESEIGLSILAVGKQTAKKINGIQTNVIEKFHSVLSVDWVTEPGAGGRVTEIWESYQPARTREQEISMLESLKAAEALAQLRESRPDVIAAILAEQDDATARQAERDEAAAKVTEAEAKAAAAEERATKAEEQAKGDRAQSAKVSHALALKEALEASELPAPTRAKLVNQLVEPVLKEDGSYDADVAKTRIVDAIKVEKEYVAALMAESGAKTVTGVPSQVGGTGIIGLGTAKATQGGTQVSEGHSKVISDLSRRFGGGAPKAAEVVSEVQTA